MMRAPPLRRAWPASTASAAATAAIAAPAAPPAPSAGLIRFLRHQSERLFTTDCACALCSRGCSSSSVASRRTRRPAVSAGPARRLDSATLAKRRPAVAHAALRAPFSAAMPFSTTCAVRARWADRRPKRTHADHSAPPKPATQAPWYYRLWDWQGSPGKDGSGRDCDRAGDGGGGGGWGGCGGWGGWGSRSGRSGRRSLLLQPGDLPDPSARAEFSSVMFNARRLQTAKAALEPRLRCTEVDENGKVILAEGEFKKTELIAKYGLLPRDLRKIDSSNLPHILVRPAAILLNLLHLKVLIKADRVLLFDVYGSKTSYPQSAFMYDLQGRLQQKSPPPEPGAGTEADKTGDHEASPGSASGPGSASVPLPYEFRALEAVLLSVTSELEAEFDTVREPVMRILSALEQDITRDRLRVLLVMSKRVSTFEQKAKLVRDAIDELLEADDDLAAMYLTEKKHDRFRGEDDHTEVEMLLESYHKICDEVAQEAGSLVSSIRNTEEIIRAILDANRNALMLLDLKFSIGTLGLAMGTFLAGLYGMNLENFIEESHWGFGAVTGSSIVFSLLICWYGLGRLRRVQRVKMHGHGPAAARHPAADDLLAAPHWSTGNAFSAVPPGPLGLPASAAPSSLWPAGGPGAAAAAASSSAAAAAAASSVWGDVSHAPLDAHSRERLRRLGMLRRG